jgi:hypothetical protein
MQDTLGRQGVVFLTCPAFCRALFWVALDGGEESGRVFLLTGH